MTKSRANVAGPIAAVAVVCGLLVLVLIGVQLPVWSWIQAVIADLQHGGVVAIVGFSLIHILAIVLLVPVSPFVLVAGFVLGTAGGSLLVTFDNLVGTTAAFLLAQRTLRPVVTQFLARNGQQRHRHMRAIDRAMQLGGFQAVVLLRLSPIVPMSILNYGLGLFDISLARYIAATTLGLLPITLLYCWGASGAQKLSELASAGGFSSNLAAESLQQALFWLGLAATFGAVWWLNRLARKALDSSS